MEDIKVFDPIVQVAIVVVIGLVYVFGYWLYKTFNKSKIKWNKIVYSIFFYLCRIIYKIYYDN
jgi:hypothetical protein